MKSTAFVIDPSIPHKADDATTGASLRFDLVPLERDRYRVTLTRAGEAEFRFTVVADQKLTPASGVDPARYANRVGLFIPARELEGMLRLYRRLDRQANSLAIAYALPAILLIARNMIGLETAYLFSDFEEVLAAGMDLHFRLPPNSELIRDY